MFSERAFRDQLIAAQDAGTLAGIFRDWQPQH
jgi:hypothetical protein